MLNKDDIRKSIITKRNNINPLTRQAYSYSIMEKLLEFLINKKIQNIYSYSSIQSEVESSFLNQFITEHHFFKLFLPRVNNRDLEFCMIHSYENDLSIGKYNILEPCPALSVNNEIDNFILIMPGLSFDLNGNRLGYGKGYYDLFLSQYSPICKIALAFECQIVDSIPAEAHDIPIDFIITEKNLHEIKKLS